MRDTILHLLPSFIDHSGPARALEIYFNSPLFENNGMFISGLESWEVYSGSLPFTIPP